MSFQTDLYDSILSDIITLTARPDLEGESEIALKTATLSTHHAEMFPRDMVTQLVQLPNGVYQAQLDIANLFPRLRGVSFIKPVDVNYATLNQKEYEIDVVEIGDLYEPDGTQKSNIAYQAGSSLNIRVRELAYGFLVGWFQAPSVEREQYNSWVAQLYKSPIIFWAAAIVLDTNGNEAKAQKYLRQVNEIYLPYLRNNYLLGKAR